MPQKTLGIVPILFPLPLPLINSFLSSTEAFSFHGVPLVDCGSYFLSDWDPICKVLPQLRPWLYFLLTLRDSDLTVRSLVRLELIWVPGKRLRIKFLLPVDIQFCCCFVLFYKRCSHFPIFVKNQLTVGIWNLGSWLYSIDRYAYICPGTM